MRENNSAACSTNWLARQTGHPTSPLDEAPYFTARTRAITELLSRQRAEEAHALFDETLELATAAPPSVETLNALRNLIFTYSRMGDPERIEDLIATGASFANSVEIPGRSRNQASAARREATTAEKSDLEREIHERSESVRRLDLVNADRQVEDIETTLRLLDELEDPELAGNFFMNLPGFYFGLQGELGPEFRRQGLDYVKQIKEVRELESPPTQQRRSRSLDRLEANIYGMWLWSDPAEASLALEKFPEAIRYRALASYLANLTQPRFRMWRIS